MCKLKKIIVPTLYMSLAFSHLIYAFYLFNLCNVQVGLDEHFVARCMFIPLIHWVCMFVCLFSSFFFIQLNYRYTVAFIRFTFFSFLSFYFPPLGFERSLRLSLGYFRTGLRLWIYKSQLHDLTHCPNPIQTVLFLGFLGRGGGGGGVGGGDFGGPTPLTL